jgi:hypothetical protein
VTRMKGRRWPVGNRPGAGSLGDVGGRVEGFSTLVIGSVL